MKMSDAYYKRREKMRKEMARMIKSDCMDEYPDCSHCAFRKQVGNKISACSLGTKPKDWDI